MAPSSGTLNSSTVSMYVVKESRDIASVYRFIYDFQFQK